MNENAFSTLFTRLAAPFHPNDVEWRAGATNSDKTRALALAYITSRAVMDRLDEVVGPENWRNEYAPGPDGGVICGLSLRVDSEWITKWDGAENTNIEAIKGGLSDAFKRAAVKWGIGRYLYRLEGQWVVCEAVGKSVSLKGMPTLPAWALPDEWVTTSGSVVSRNTSAQTSIDREQQILSELGFGNKQTQMPAPVPALQTSGGNGSSHKPQSVEVHTRPRRALSWSMTVVQAVLNAGLAANPVEAVGLLNASDLPQDATPEQAVAHLKKHT